MGIVESAVRDKEKLTKEKILRKQKISDGWFQRFIEWQPQLCMRKGDSTAIAHVDAMKKQEELDNYFISLKSILVKYNLIKKPDQIFNVNETGMPLEHWSPRVLARKG